jgi:hypothetical protein
MLIVWGQFNKDLFIHEEKIQEAMTPLMLIDLKTHIMRKLCNQEITDSWQGEAKEAQDVVYEGLVSAKITAYNSYF